jgi:hypothetical protein
MVRSVSEAGTLSILDLEALVSQNQEEGHTSEKSPLRCPPPSIGEFEYHEEVVDEEQMTEPLCPQEILVSAVARSTDTRVQRVTSSSLSSRGIPVHPALYASTVTVLPEFVIQNIRCK